MSSSKYPSPLGYPQMPTVLPSPPALVQGTVTQEKKQTSRIQAPDTVNCVAIQAGSPINPKLCGTFSGSTGKSSFTLLPSKVSPASQAMWPKGAPHSRVILFYQSCRGLHSGKTTWISPQSCVGVEVGSPLCQS
ncbi:hypothetical protein HJG60_011346 [Phyllostomus discolor]|uniref:Uncharacterized protein n=1 Tax=Phyllostomus discolor TaxID=89673 RepID=A0A834E1Q8_9CHIR|nr:hypothetical protein HJG60_011346 [Phyllostomus discolor]